MTTQFFHANHALRSENYIAAIQEYIKLLQQSSSSLEKTLVFNHALARKKYRDSRLEDDIKKVAVCGWELSHNAAGRVYTLAQLYQTFTEVEIIGSIFPRYGNALWEPIRNNTQIPVHSFIVNDESQFIEQALQLVLAHPYDIVHLSKPRIPNIFFGILYKLIWGSSVLVDIDDEELAFAGTDKPITIEEYIKLNGNLPPLQGLDNQVWTRLAVGLAKEFDGVTVSNPALQQRYGGEIIRHARDEKLFKPSPELKRASRQKYGIPLNAKVVLFFGTPRKHKGLLETADAIAELNRGDIIFLIVGSFPRGSLSLKEELLHKKRIKYKFLENQPFDKVPEIVAMGDICVLLQDINLSVSKFQVPAKLSDALMGGLLTLVYKTPSIEDLINNKLVILFSQPKLLDVIDSKPRKTHISQYNLIKNEFGFKENAEKLLRIEKRLSFFSKKLIFLSESINIKLLKLLNEKIGYKVATALPVEPKRVIRKLNIKSTEKKIAVVVHYFYPHIWEEISKRLKKLDAQFDLFVTISSNIKNSSKRKINFITKDILSEFPSARVFWGSNIGMDIVPFLSIIPILSNEGYQAVCKIHTKKGESDKDRIWRDLMFDSLIGSTKNFTLAANAFFNNSNVSFVGPASLYQSAQHLMLDNKKNLDMLCEQMLSHETPTTDWGFFAGSMFWCRPSCLEDISYIYNLSNWIEDGNYKLDGKLEHALERYFGLIATSTRMKVGLLHLSGVDACDCCTIIMPANKHISHSGITNLMAQYPYLKQNRETIKESLLFDEFEYLNRFPELENTSVDLIIHYLTIGIFNNVKPNKYFDPNEYRAINSDIDYKKTEPFAHYLKLGAKEKRILRKNNRLVKDECYTFRLMALNTNLIDWNHCFNKKRDYNCVSIVIPVYGQGELLIKCINSLFSIKNNAQFEIILVDNRHDDETSKLITDFSANYQNVRSIKNEENFNFALGCNIGFSVTNTEYCVFLNSDTVVTDYWLDKLISRLDDPTITAVQPKLLYPDRTIQCCGIVFSQWSNLGYPIYAGFDSKDPVVNYGRRFKAVTAACVAIRSKDFAQHRGFDPIFINGQEDVDLCLRLNDSEEKSCWYEPSSVVLHYEGKSTGRLRHVSYNRKNFIARWKKHNLRDDYKYYEQDQFSVKDWKVDNAENINAGIEIYRPNLEPC
ncbi:rhamnan synthesis F family protein [Candidatus Venteria ishoeyi]|uniref:rhamnan synthesis F family protein n=1 Tax=Candidatus Venteria ishoeyi TaxID=1899563 RepID=UPI0025A51D9B|nr:rhamnan synthesis F family protein [Candidatus Venteria ishoeyi]MDM8546310.1 rhamnan synthesis F family protein [Candidatus Venteria ishoeyi]